MGNRLKELRKQRSLTQTQLAKMVGVAQGSIQKLENGEITLDVKWLKRLSEVLHVPPYELLPENMQPQIKITTIPVVGFVQAGTFQPAEEWDQNNFYTINPPFMPEYNGMKMFALEVRGDSMDLLYPSGTCVICVPAIDYGMPETGKKVICERHLPDGTIEATVKEYRRTDNGTYLVPHSSNPAYAPCRLDTGDCGECGIVAVVIGSFRKE